VLSFQGFYLYRTEIAKMGLRSVDLFTFLTLPAKFLAMQSHTVINYWSGHE